MAFYQEFSVLFLVSINEKRREQKVAASLFILKSNRETVKDGMKLKNKSKQMPENCPFVGVVSDTWCPE